MAAASSAGQPGKSLRIPSAIDRASASSCTARRSVSRALRRVLTSASARHSASAFFSAGSSIRRPRRSYRLRDRLKRITTAQSLLAALALRVSAASPRPRKTRWSSSAQARQSGPGPSMTIRFPVPWHSRQVQSFSGEMTTSSFMSESDDKRAQMGEDPIPLALAISPSGAVHLDARPPPESCVPAALARTFTADLARGPGFAILQLAARHPGETLPPSVAFFRDLGALFLARACALPEGGVVAPLDELARLAAGAPPISGGEYLRTAALEALWLDLDAALRDELRQTSLEQWFKDRHAAWNVVGRVCFHLAENKADEQRPFAFLATYTTRLSRAAQPQHRPLGQALRDFASDKSALLSLLLPVQRASAQSALAKELADSGQVFRTLTWTPAEALCFLREVPAFEAAGIVVRIPDWWKKRARVSVDVRLGGRKPPALGLDALVDFDVRQALAGLRSPDALEKLLPGPELRAELRPYQEVGVRWLSFTAGLGLGSCLADDMGLGKTLQVLAFLLTRRKAGQAAGPSLLVAPASLLGNWSA